MDYFYRQVCECLSSAPSVTPGRSYAAATWSCSTCASTSGLFVQATNVCLPFSMIFTFGAVYDACCKNAWAEGNLPPDSAYADQSGLWPHQTHTHN